MPAGLLALLLAPLSAAPSPPPSPEPRPGTVVRVTVGLVQVDAVVTDKQGRQVTDLGAADFVIKEEGQEREITQVSYVRVAPPAGATETPPVASPSPGAEPSPPPRRGRMMTLVVDDLNVSFEGLSRLRDALHRYIDKHVSAGDRVAILRTGGAASVMEQFTSNTARLHAAADGLRYNYSGMAGVGG